MIKGEAKARAAAASCALSDAEHPKRNYRIAQASLFGKR